MYGISGFPLTFCIADVWEFVAGPAPKQLMIGSDKMFG